MTTTTYRAAYWTSNDGQHEIVLTGFDQAHLTDDELLRVAVVEYTEHVGNDPEADGVIVIGDWTE